MELHPLQEGPRGFVELQKNHLTNPMPKQFNTCKAKFCVQESPDTMRTKKRQELNTSMSASLLRMYRNVQMFKIQH
jgi:hypothetical protein